MLISSRVRQKFIIPRGALFMTGVICLTSIIASPQAFAAWGKKPAGVGKSKTEAKKSSWGRKPAAESSTKPEAKSEAKVETKAEPKAAESKPADANPENKTDVKPEG